MRVAHRFGGTPLAVLYLLFAMSWKKVRGGERVQWIGYQLDVVSFSKGISKKKVQWVLEWIRRHRAAGGVTGREFKAALGRLTLVGSLHGQRCRV